MFLPAVPPPVVNVALSLEEVYAGSSMVLRCNIQVSDAVDTEIAVSLLWTKDDDKLSDMQHLEISDIKVSGLNLYESQVYFSPLAYKTHDGEYSCVAEIDLGVNSSFIKPSLNASDSVSINAASKSTRLYTNTVM